MEMGKLLEQLYAGDLAPADRTVQGNARYDMLCSRSLKKIESFSERLDADMRREFDEIMEQCLELTYIEKTQTFSDGFRIGAGIMYEVFSEPVQGSSCPQ